LAASSFVSLTFFSGSNASHGVIVKTYSVTNLAVKGASPRYSPAEVIAGERQVVNGDAEMQISTSYVERSNLTLRMSSKRFARLSNGFSKRLEQHCAALSLYVMHYNFCRVHESLRTRQRWRLALRSGSGRSANCWTQRLRLKPITPKTTAPMRRRRFQVIDGGNTVRKFGAILFAQPLLDGSHGYEVAQRRAGRNHPPVSQDAF
jgi:IS1 family transposase